MRVSQEELKKAILTVAKSLNLEKSIEYILSSQGIYTAVKDIIYQLFVEDRQQYFEKDDNVFHSMTLIREYCKEMGRNGFVKFDQPYQSK